MWRLVPCATRCISFKDYQIHDLNDMINTVEDRLPKIRLHEQYGYGSLVAFPSIPGR